MSQLHQLHKRKKLSASELERKKTNVTWFYTQKTQILHQKALELIGKFNEVEENKISIDKTVAFYAPITS